MNQNKNDKPQPCPGCGLRYQCICNLIPGYHTDWHLALLTHPNETARDTNTGKLLAKTLPNSSIHIWDRVTPPARLIEQINSGKYQPFLLFPSGESKPLTKEMPELKASQLPALFILLDGTWQEAQKMLRKSPWLKELPPVHIEGDFISEYQLRRNQEKGNLCTYEVGIELLNILNSNQTTEEVKRFFSHYLLVFHSDKSGHKYKNNLE